MAPKQRQIVRVEDVVRRRPEVVAEDEIPVEAVDDEIRDDRVGFAFEGVEIDGCSRSLDEPRDPARFADHFNVAGQAATVRVLATESRRRDTARGSRGASAAPNSVSTAASYCSTVRPAGKLRST